MSPVQAVAVVLVGLVGVATVLSATPRARRPRLAARLLPYLGAVTPGRSSLLDPTAGQAGVPSALAPLVALVAERLGQLLPDRGDSIAARLAAAGSPMTSAQLRTQQAVWGLLGAAGGLVLMVFVAGAGRAVSPVVALAAALAIGVGAAMARDAALSRAVERRRAAAAAELPTIADLLCVAVTAGESLHGAVTWVAGASDGPIGVELRVALREARAVGGLTSAIEHRAGVLGLPAFDRVAAALAAAQERGVPLADALRAVATDVRDGERHELIEAAGRKQVSMLVPVVALVLPVALVFAFFPGVIAIRTLTR